MLLFIINAWCLGSTGEKNAKWLIPGKGSGVSRISELRCSVVQVTQTKSVCVSFFFSLHVLAFFILNYIVSYI